MYTTVAMKRIETDGYIYPVALNNLSLTIIKDDEVPLLEDKRSNLICSPPSRILYNYT